MNELHHYPSSGLECLYLKNGFTRHETSYGVGFSYADEDGLLKAAAVARALQGGGMAGEELRFLRSELDMTQAELGNVFNKSDQAVAKWEKGETDMKADTILAVRLLVLKMLAPDMPIGEIDIEAPAERKVVLSFESGEWGAAKNEAIAAQLFAKFSGLADRVSFQSSGSTAFASMFVRNQMIDHARMSELRFYGNDELYGEGCDEAQSAVA